MAITRQVGRRVVVLQNTEAEVSTNQTIAPQYTWTVNGELTVPTETALDALHQIDATAQLQEVRVSARTAGDSQYNIKVINRNLLGANVRVLVDQTLTFSGDREIYSLVISDATLEQHSTLEVTLHEIVPGAIPAKDLTVSAIVETFGVTSPVRNGHVIQRDDNTSLPQQEILKFAGDVFSTVDNPGDGKTEVTVTAQSVINLVYPIGSYITADITEAQMQAQVGTGFILADGRSVIGSAYETLTGNSNIPDARGQFLRSKNEGRVDGNENPDGEIALGTYSQDEFQGHEHEVDLYNGGSGAGKAWSSAVSDAANDPTVAIVTDGVNGSPRFGSETRPKNITVNRFIRIN